MEEKKTIEELEAEVRRLNEWNLRFFKRVQFMRQLQKEYFKGRDHETLRKSKAVESEIDGIIADLQRRLDERNAREAARDPAIQAARNELEQLFDAVEVGPSNTRKPWQRD